MNLIQFFKLFSLGEKEDAGRFLDTKIRRGDCIAFEAGDKVNLTRTYLKIAGRSRSAINVG